MLSNFHDLLNIQLVNMEAREKKFVPKAKNKQQRAEQFKKFIGNKYEGQGFADKRKKKIQYEYRKMLQKEHRSAAAVAAATSASSSSAAAGKSDDHSSAAKGKKHFRKPEKVHMKGQSSFSKAAEENKQRKEQKQKKKQEALEHKQERQQAMQAYQKRKKENFKKICKKTHKGQPVMKNQIEYLLQKIERQVNQT